MIFRESLSVGLDIGRNAVKIAGIKKQRIPKIEFLWHYDFVLSGKVKRLEELTDTIIVQTLREILKEIPLSIKRVHTTLSTPETEVRTIEMPLINSGEIKPALRWNLASVIVAPIEEVEYDYFVLNRNKNANTMNVLVGLASREKLTKHLDILHRTRLEPLSVDIDSLAIYNAFVSLYPFKENQTVILMNIGAEKTTVIICHPEHDPTIISHPIGGNTITRQIESYLHISFKDAEEQKINYSLSTDRESLEFLPIPEAKWQEFFYQFANQLSDIINQINIYYQVQNGVDPAEKILITGGGSNLTGLDLFLAQKSRISVQRWDPTENGQISYHSEKSGSKINGIQFTTAIGLALRD
ncbi:MAG: pilus assembly protein PilM [Candidatus Marinimicrobia bacterium]|nr:pilus assembly protein PilM [Candidatus Neomarinimicrobiota bacterium]